MKKPGLILVILVVCNLHSCQTYRFHYFMEDVHVLSQKIYHHAEDDVSNNAVYDSIVKGHSVSDTMFGQLIATQTMLYFSPDPPLTDSSNNTAIKKALYIVEKAVKIDGQWKTIDLERIRTLGGIQYPYMTKENKYGRYEELYTTARIDGIDDSNTLYAAQCKVILYHSNKIIPSLLDNWCVYYNDLLFNFDCVKYSLCAVEVVR